MRLPNEERGDDGPASAGPRGDEPQRVRVVCAMSGGVDSAVAAALLDEAGYEVVGVTMKVYEPSRPAQARSCCGIRDFDDARRCAAILGIPHYVLDFQEAFRREVVARFIDDYRNGRTPNPCVNCNAFVKLGTLRAFGRRLGARFVATGHYARLVHADDGPHLFAARDAEKDQSYALAGCAPEQLGALLLPLGDRTKAQTRAEAARFGLPVAQKPDSQEICFVEGGDYRELLARAGTEAPGPILTTAGARIAEHTGISRYTVGQRRALPATTSNDGPRYVTRIDPNTNAIVIGREDELYACGLVADALNLIRPERFAGPTSVRARTRHRAPLGAALATVDRAAGTLTLAFGQPERAVTPGQLVALCDAQGEVLAGATIREAL
ncbi:MAG: tRNA 2-thiouridine(34) synthase MnmA [Vulcanimicrobiaceae bacterium]